MIPIASLNSASADLRWCRATAFRRCKKGRPPLPRGLTAYSPPKFDSLKRDTGNSLARHQRACKAELGVPECHPGTPATKRCRRPRCCRSGGLNQPQWHRHQRRQSRPTFSACHWAPAWCRRFLW